MTTPANASFPADTGERDDWILARRGPRQKLDAERPYAFLMEEERFASGDIGNVATIFLTNRECPWRCTMCDLWRNTLTETLAPGFIPRQIEYALNRLLGATQVKLYNSGSFFDPRAIPVEDYAAIGRLVDGFERVIVESHPALVGENCFQFAEMIGGQMEVAMGLETAHAEVLEKLNKRMTLQSYVNAAERLLEHGIDVRSFILVQPPFMRSEEALEWGCKSIDFAIHCGATAMTLIPTRPGNGATDALLEDGNFVQPSLGTIEECLDYGIKTGGSRVFVDLWDSDRIKGSCECRLKRIERLAEMNRSQILIEPIRCSKCGQGQ